MDISLRRQGSSLPTAPPRLAGGLCLSLPSRCPPRELMLLSPSSQCSFLFLIQKFFLQFGKTIHSRHVVSCNYFPFAVQCFVSCRVSDCLAFCFISFLCTYSLPHDPPWNPVRGTGCSASVVSLRVPRARTPRLSAFQGCCIAHWLSLHWHPTLSYLFYFSVYTFALYL